MNTLVLVFLVNGRYNQSVSYPSGTCGESRFNCADGACIDDLNLCNGVRDCPDGSDETSATCQNFYCPPYAFRCSYGACIQGSYECNGHSDCVDNSDELSLNCLAKTAARECGFDGFRCASGQCVNQSNVCNGRRDCLDGSDETPSQCQSHYCPPFAFRCRYGACIAGRKRCNGMVDCSDGSDEGESLCANSTVTLDADRIMFRDEDERIPMGSNDTIGDIKK